MILPLRYLKFSILLKMFKSILPDNLISSLESKSLFSSQIWLSAFHNMIGFRRWLIRPKCPITNLSNEISVETLKSSSSKPFVINLTFLAPSSLNIFTHFSLTVKHILHFFRTWFSSDLCLLIEDFVKWNSFNISSSDHGSLKSAIHFKFNLFFNAKAIRCIEWGGPVLMIVSIEFSVNFFSK